MLTFLTVLTCWTVQVLLLLSFNDICYICDFLDRLLLDILYSFFYIMTFLSILRCFTFLTVFIFRTVWHSDFFLQFFFKTFSTKWKFWNVWIFIIFIFYVYVFIYIFIYILIYFWLIKFVWHYCHFYIFDMLDSLDYFKCLTILTV